MMLSITNSAATRSGLSRSVTELCLDVLTTTTTVTLHTPSVDPDPALRSFAQHNSHSHCTKVRLSRNMPRNGNFDERQLRTATTATATATTVNSRAPQHELRSQISLSLHSPKAKSNDERTNKRMNDNEQTNERTNERTNDPTQ